MATVEKNIWNDLLAKVGHIPGREKYVERLRRQYREASDTGKAIARIEGESVYSGAIELLASEIEQMFYQDKMQRSAERHGLKKKEFWLSIYEETGLDGKEILCFDPEDLEIRKQNSDSPGENPESYDATLNGLAETVNACLYNPLIAGRVVYDSCVPWWIRDMARVISHGNLKPVLRKNIQLCIEEPGLARKMSSLAVQEKMPDWFVELTKVLGSRKSDTKIKNMYLS